MILILLLLFSNLVDYGIKGTLFVVYLMFFLKNKNKNKSFIDYVLLFFFLIFLNPIEYIYSVPFEFILIIYGDKIENIKSNYFKTIYVKFKYFFYWFYPLHLVLLKFLFFFRNNL